ncbi:hypothetical protein H1D32_05585 [Anaerobacillus sp. CMMVII]|uniref:hypothetical protein n=1 Tax=Anaerobacillus sp. CMMVII TaxID=2755588 RepID=UPI0021B77986|nr:hypothetical protein [Anaerobacillus sp. CMMVII]MCT8137262.1 hypothetical protein [Anaerobacillus sp. CMMVII]
MKKIGYLLTCFLLSFLVACGGSNTEGTLITFLDETITEKDAENARVTPEETLEDAAKDLLFQEMMLVEAEQAGISFDQFDLDALVNQTQQLFEYDQEAISFLNAKSELYNISPEEYIETIWRDGLRKKLIANNYLAEFIDFQSLQPEDVQSEVEKIRNELLAKYEDQIEYHF